MPKVTIFTRAHLPDSLSQQWLQHLRDFDAAHPECHFEVAIDGSNGTPILDVIEMMRVDPALNFTAVFDRKRT